MENFGIWNLLQAFSKSPATSESQPRTTQENTSDSTDSAQATATSTPNNPLSGILGTLLQSMQNAPSTPSTNGTPSESSSPQPATPPPQTVRFEKNVGTQNTNTQSIQPPSGNHSDSYAYKMFMKISAAHDERVQRIRQTTQSKQ